MVELGISPGYVLDRMEMYEISALMDHKHLKHRESWEQARMVSFINARCAGAKIEDAKGLFSLPWDGEESKEKIEEDLAQFDRLKANAERMIEEGWLE